MWRFGRADPAIAPTNRIQAWLAAAGVPWTEPRDDLIRRLGACSDDPLFVRIQLDPPRLMAVCRTGQAHCPSRALPIASAAGPEDLNDRAAALSAATGRPLRLQTPTLDA